MVSLVRDGDLVVALPSAWVTFVEFSFHLLTEFQVGELVEWLDFGDGVIKDPTYCACVELSVVADLSVPGVEDLLLGGIIEWSEQLRLHQ